LLLSPKKLESRAVVPATKQLSKVPEAAALVNFMMTNTCDDSDQTETVERDAKTEKISLMKKAKNEIS
jgi:hypothetical protein